MSVLVSLGDICRPKQWKTLSKSEMSEAGFPVYGANGRIGYADSYTHEEPTILVGCRGSCGTVIITQPKSYANGNAMALDSLDQSRVDLQYLYRYLSFRGFRDVTTGTSQPQIIGSNLRRVEVPLPPLAEQRRIAAILDKADALRAKRREAIAKLDQLLQSVFLNMFGDPVENPKGWRKAPLSELFNISRGGSPRPIDEYLTERDDGINWIMISDASGGSKYIDRTKKRIKPEGARRSRLVGPGDFLLTNSMSFGRPYIMRTSGCIHDGWLVLSPKDEATNQDFMYALLSSPAVYQEFARRAPGATVKNLNIDLVREVEVPVPPSDVQRRFSQAVLALEKFGEMQKAGLAQAEALFESVQQQAFSVGL